jgi:DNA-binding winged helix-turn-helix (wHTH) protein
VRVRFGDFVVDDATRQLMRGGVAIHMSPKAFDLLVALLRERPNVLSKEDLHARLWPKTFVSDASLAMIVAEVRAALGETARQPSAIRTVHRRGYAFQADAVDSPQAADVVAVPAGSVTGCWLVTTSRQIALTPGDNIVGRDPAAQVWLDSPSVSRRHARIRVEAGRARLEDLDSKNGTFVGDRRVDEVIWLGDGDDVRFGSVGTRFRTWAAEATRTEGGA